MFSNLSCLCLEDRSGVGLRAARWGRPSKTSCLASVWLARSFVARCTCPDRQPDRRCAAAANGSPTPRLAGWRTQAGRRPAAGSGGVRSGGSPAKRRPFRRLAGRQSRRVRVRRVRGASTDARLPVPRCQPAERGQQSSLDLAVAEAAAAELLEARNYGTNSRSLPQLRVAAEAEEWNHRVSSSAVEKETKVAEQRRGTTQRKKARVSPAGQVVSKGLPLCPISNPL